MSNSNHGYKIFYKNRYVSVCEVASMALVGDVKAREILIMHYCESARRFAEKYSKRLTSDERERAEHFEILYGECVVRVIEVVDEYISNNNRPTPLVSQRLQGFCSTYVKHEERFKELLYVPDECEADNEQMISSQRDENKDVFKDVCKTMAAVALKNTLRTLTEKEQKILNLRFGLEDGRTRTLEETGKEFGVSGERVREIEAKALRKLRYPTRAKNIKGYLEAF